MQIAARRDRTKNYFILPPLPHDENSQEVQLVRKTSLIAKVNNSKLKLINNDRYVISKINIQENEITVKQLETKQNSKMKNFKKFLTLMKIILRNYLKLVMFLRKIMIDILLLKSIHKKMK
jgi:hypothetical protein